MPKRSTCCATSFRVAKNLYRNPGGGAFLRRGVDALTADTPVPYRIADLIKQIDERIGLLEGKNERPILKSLRTRIESALADPRYRFMFNSRLIEDTIHETIGNIFRVPTTAARSPASKWPACPRKWSTRSARCWRASPSTSRCGAKAG